MEKHKDTEALIVTWEPDPAVLLELIGSLLADQCPCHVIDNGSSNAGQLRDAFSTLPASLFSVCWLPGNTGLGSALNRGIRRALDRGVRHLLLFDQDSAIDPGFCTAMREARSRLDGLSRKPVAAMGPRLQDPDSGRRTPFRVFDRWWSRSDRTLVRGSPFHEAGFLVTSGTLLDLACIGEVGFMREDYFIDNIDLEWCFRAASRGYALVGTDCAVLHHRIGEASGRWLVRRGWLVEHGPERCYYSTRNRFHLHRQPHAPGGWKWRDRIRFLLKAVWLLLFTGRRREYWRSLRSGLRDARGLE